MPPQRKEPESGKKRFFTGVFLLFSATFLAKLIGLFYKIPLIRIVGVEGMAYFLAAYHIYSLLFVLSATGLPNALSLLVARAEAANAPRTARRCFRVAAVLFLLLGLLGTASLILFARPLAARLSMRESAAAIAAIAPSLFLAGWIGAVRGYFQGRQQMMPTAVSEVSEAVGKLVFGLLFSLLAARRGATPPQLAAAAILGITAGMCLSALILLVLYLADRLGRRATERGDAPAARQRILPSLIKLALPMTLSASVMSLVSLVDTALISGRLQAAGYAPSVANSLYSAYGNLAVPLYNLVPTLLSPLSLALMPMLGAALAKRDGENAAGLLLSGLRLTAFIAIPAALGLSAFSAPILAMIYRGESDAVAVAAPLLTLLGVCVVPACFIALTGAALQALGRPGVPVIAMSAGALLKLVTEFFLLTLPAVGIFAAPISTLFCNTAVLCIQLTVLCRVFPFRVSPARDLFRPLFAALCGTGAGIGVYRGLSRVLGTTPCLCLTLCFTVCFYLFLSLRFSALTREDLDTLPFGGKICPVFEKLRLFPKPLKNKE